jgi:hypothetical protein
LNPLRSIAKLLWVDARRAAVAGDGDGEKALADVTAMSGVSRHAAETPNLISLFVAAAIQKMQYAAIHELLIDYPALWTDVQLRDLAHSVAAADIDWRRGYEGERAIFCDMLQRLYTDDGKGDGRITAEGLRHLRDYSSPRSIDYITGLKNWRMKFGDPAVAAFAPASLFVVASRREIIDKYDELISIEKAKLDTPFWKLEQPCPEDPQTAWRRDLLRYLPISLMPLPDFRGSLETHQGQRDGVLSGIALELFRRKHDGRWPDSLAELAPGYLPHLPVDRITGGPLHYKIVDDRPLVYSVGADRDDDSGRVPAGDDGEPDVILASPFYSGPKPPSDSSHDGDWVIWSTEIRKEQGAASEGN